MKNLEQIAERLKIRIADKQRARDLDCFIESVDLSNPDEIVIQTCKKKSAIKIKNGQFEVYGYKKDEEILRIFSGLFISFLGWDNAAFPIEQSKLISYKGRMPAQKASAKNKTEAKLPSDDDAVLTVRAGSSHKAKDTSGAGPKASFAQSAATQEEQLQKRAEVWKSRGLEKVDVRDDSVWVTVKENVEIEDRGEELKLYGDFDLQAITLMVSHAKETWNNNCWVHGDDKFKTLVWRECYLQGVTLQGFEPEPQEKERILSATRCSQSGSTQNAAPQPMAA